MARNVRVLVELHAVLQAFSQRELEGQSHSEAQDRREEEKHVKEDAANQKGLQQGLPLGKLGGVQRVVADFPNKGIDAASYQPNQDQQVGNKVAFLVVHHLAPLVKFSLEKEAHTKDQDSHQNGKPAH